MPLPSTPRLLLRALLALPAAVLIVRGAAMDAADLEGLLKPSGEMAARLMIVALVATPLSQLFPGSAPARWLVTERRSFGVAAFCYAALHALFYAAAMGSAADMLAEIGATGIWTGWAALALMLPLALTSNDAAMRWLRSGWKRLQRLAYPATLLTLLHWVYVHNGVAVAIGHFVPLAMLQSFRILLRWRKPAATERTV